MAISVPSESVPVIMSKNGPISGAARAPSICACVTESKLGTCNANCKIEDGATIGFSCPNKAATSGSLAIAPKSSDICESPLGVSASPLNRSVTTLTSEAPKLSSISLIASVIALP